LSGSDCQHSRFNNLKSSCPDLIRASPPYLVAPQDVDGRDKPGHDEKGERDQVPEPQR